MHGQPDDAGVDLTDPSGMWIVERGHVDCFAVELGTEGEAGRLRPLFTVAAGDVLIGMNSRTGPLNLHAALSSDAFCRRLNGLPELPLLSRWLRLLLDGVTPSGHDEVDRLEHLGPVSLPARKRIGVVGSLLITVVRSERILVGGVVWDAADGPILAVDPLWIEAVDAADLHIKAATAGSQEIGNALVGTHRHYLKMLERWWREEVDAERKRLRLRASGERDAIDHALRQLASAARGLIDEQPVKSRSHDRHTAAIAPVLQILGLPLKPAPACPTVDRALDAQGVRYRRVLLRSGWQKDSAEPLIGFLRSGMQPVALLPGSRWRMIGWHLDQPVDATAEANLIPVARQIYRVLPSQRMSFAQLMRLGLRGSAHDGWRVLFLAMLTSLGGVAPPLVMGAIFETLIPNADRGGILAVIALLLVVALASGAFAVASARAVHRIEARFEVNVTPLLMDRLLRLPTGFFRNYGVGDLVDRLLGIQHVRSLLGPTFSQLVVYFVLGLASLTVLIGFDLAVGGAAFLLAGTIGCLDVLISVQQVRLSRVIQRDSARLSGLVLQIVHGIAKLRTAAAERRALVQWARHYAPIVQHTARLRAWVGFRLAMGINLPVAAVAILYAVIAARAATLSIGAVVAVTAAFGQLLAASLGLGRLWNQVAQAVPLIERARPLLETAPEAQAGAEPIDRIRGEIALRSVSFRYGPDSPLILDEITLDIPPGSFCAVVGPSGSGKSTLLRLLLGFEAPTSGQLLVDGRFLDRIDPYSLRSQIGVVLQDGRVLSGSILENIVGPTGLGIGEAWSAARMVGLADEIEAMPMGMHTVLLDGGGTLSGGQRQRLLIARALVNKPRVLLFDEATSALDNRTQAIVTETLGRLAITRLVIAHRLSTIEGADCVFVIERGRLVQQGSFRDLIEGDGLFADLAKRQQAV